MQPLETQVPIAGNVKDQNIFQMMGHLSHYFPNPDGFGVDEYSLPPGAKISHLHMLSRHGARYPTVYAGGYRLAKALEAVSSTIDARGPLEFLNGYQFTLGAELLVPVGKQEYVFPFLLVLSYICSSRLSLESFLLFCFMLTSRQTL